MSGKLVIESVPLDSIHPHTQNPRLGDIAAIADSLKTLTQYKPIVVREETNEILAGNQTYAAAKKLGWDEIQVVHISVNDTDAKRIVLADNRTHDLGAYNDPLLANLLQDVMAEDVDLLDGTGYTEGEVEALLASTVTDVEVPTEVDEEEVGTAVAALNRMLPATEEQEARAGSISGLSPEELPEIEDASVGGELVPEPPPPSDPVEFIFARIGEVRFKIHREAWEALYDSLLEGVGKAPHEVLYAVAGRLGLSEDDVEPVALQGPESWRG